MGPLLRVGRGHDAQWYCRPWSVRERYDCAKSTEVLPVARWIARFWVGAASQGVDKAQGRAH